MLLLGKPSCRGYHIQLAERLSSITPTHLHNSFDDDFRTCCMIHQEIYASLDMLFTKNNVIRRGFHGHQYQNEDGLDNPESYWISGQRKIVSIFHQEA